jgi:hypothetical protein
VLACVALCFYRPGCVGAALSCSGCALGLRCAFVLFVCGACIAAVWWRRCPAVSFSFVFSGLLSYRIQAWSKDGGETVGNAVRALVEASCVVLCCVVLCCVVLCCVVLCCVVLCCVVLCCVVLCCVVLCVVWELRGAVRCGAVRCGAVWCGESVVMWCGCGCAMV